MDRLEPLLQSNSNKGGTRCKFDVDYAIVYEKKKVAILLLNPVQRATKREARSSLSRNEVKRAFTKRSVVHFYEARSA